MLQRTRHSTIVKPKISDIESKYFTTSDYIKFMNEIISNKLKEKKWLMNLIFLDL